MIPMANSSESGKIVAKNDGSDKERNPNPSMITINIKAASCAAS
jgi:hypothetical protein